MSLFKDLLFATGKSVVFDKVAGGLNAKVATEHVGSFLKRSGTAVEKVARTLGLLPSKKVALAYLQEKADAAGMREECQALGASPLVLGTVWKWVNGLDWEEFCVRSDPDADPEQCRKFLQRVKEDPALERALQVVAEAEFPQLYLLRCIGLGITATDENWSARLKINTFRTFFLRLALPGKQYDKYINYYVVLTSSKDAWDELSAGQDGKLDFAMNLASNWAGVKIGQFFEERFSKIVGDKWRDITGDDAPAPAMPSTSLEQS